MILPLRRYKMIILGKIRKIYHPYLPLDTIIRKPFRIDGGKQLLIGKSVVFQSGTWLFCGSTVNSHGRLEIGENCSFGYRNHITCVGQVIIGSNVMTANNVYISDNSHSYQDPHLPIMFQPVIFTKKVEIGAGSWIGENVSILGANIGKNSVIGANSVVTSDIPDFCVAAGIPAKVIKRYNHESRKWV